MRRVPAVLLAVAWLGLAPAACGSEGAEVAAGSPTAGPATTTEPPPRTPGPGPGPGADAEEPDPAIADGSEQAALDDARRRWRAAGLRDYRFRVALSCFCPPDIRKARTITVRRGRPKAPPQHLETIATVPRLFARVQEAIDDGVAELTVDYGRRGLPTLVVIDRSRRIADDEARYTAGRLRALGSR